MKYITLLAVTAWLVFAILPTKLNAGVGQQLAQVSPASCPTLDIVAIWPRSLTVWLLLSSDKPDATPATIELTTESELAEYSFPSVTFARSVGNSTGAYRSAPIALVAPAGYVLSANVRPLTTAENCPRTGRVVRSPSAAGIFHLVAPSDDDIALEKTVAADFPVANAPVPVTGRRKAAPFACTVEHRDAMITQVVNPNYPQHARETGQVGQALVKVSLTPTGAVNAVSIYRSSGHQELDEATLAAAQASGYAPEVQRCFPVGGTYLYRADFTAVKQ